MKKGLKNVAVLILLFGGPLIMDFILGLSAFYCNLRTVDLAPPRFQCLVGVAWSLGYIITAHLAGRWCTPKRAASFMVASLLAAVVIVCTILLREPNYYFFLAANTCLGLATGLYFAPFQVKMGHVHPFHSMATVVAVYNVSWGTGLSFGAMGSGWIMDLQGFRWIACSVVSGLVVFHLLLLATIRGQVLGADEKEEEITSAFASTRLLRLCGWIGIFVAFVLLNSVIVTLWPNLGKECGLSNARIGVGAFMVSFQLPLFALVWARLSKWMCKPAMLIALLAMAGIGYLLLPLFNVLLWQYAMLAILGIGISGAIFHSVYYSNIDPSSRERSLGINETVVGCACLVGPVVMGWLAWDSGASWRPYIAGCAIAMAACVALVVLWKSGAGLAEES